MIFLFVHLFLQSPNGQNWNNLIYRVDYAIDRAHNVQVLGTSGNIYHSLTLILKRWVTRDEDYKLLIF